MHIHLRWAAAWLLAATAASASAGPHVRAVDPDQFFIERAVFAQGRLWMLADDGRLFSLAPDDKARRTEALVEPAYDLCVDRGAPVVVTAPRDAPAEFQVRRFDRHAWRTDATVAMQDDGFIALSCAGDGVSVLTRHRLIDMHGGEQRVHRLQDEVRVSGGFVSAVHATPDTLFVGTDRGEWGGELIRVDRRTGAVTQLVQRSGPFNAIVDDPWRPGCIAVARGLVHMLPSGELLEVCGDDVSTLYAAHYEGPAYRSGRLPEVPFFGLAVEAGGLLAVAPGQLHRIDAHQHAAVEKVPAAREVDGLRLSFDLPGYVLLYTFVNQRQAASGATPMLVPRGPGSE